MRPPSGPSGAGLVDPGQARDVAMGWAMDWPIDSIAVGDGPPRRLARPRDVR